MEHDLGHENTATSKMKSHFGDIKLDKSKELNDTMTINESSRDEYEKTIHSIGGNNNG